MKPSQLQEEQWIKIQVNTEHKDSWNQSPKATGAIGFHVYYGVLSCFAINHDQPANNPELGILITDDPEIADKIHEQWINHPNVTITHG